MKEKFGFNNLPGFAGAKPSYEEVEMPISTHLYIVRHGESEGNAAKSFGGHSPTPLSALGHKQAELTADYLATQDITAIYSSDLIRAVQTAEPLARKINLEVNQSPAFRERSVGILQGLTFLEAAEKFPLEYGKLLERDYDFVITEGESYAQVVARASAKLKEILQIHKGGKIALFSHTGTICFMILHLLGALETAEKPPIWIMTKNCSVTHFEFTEGSFKGSFIRCHLLNFFHHLANL